MDSVAAQSIMTELVWGIDVGNRGLFNGKGLTEFRLVCH